MKSDFQQTYKFREICYQTGVVCRRKPRIVAGIRRNGKIGHKIFPANSQNRELEVRERQGIPVLV